MTNLSLHRYKIDFTMIEPFVADNFLGSKWRGRFGEQLMKLNTDLYHSLNHPTLAQDNPAKEILLQGNQIPKPFIIYPHPTRKYLQDGDTISIELVLFGDYAKHFNELLPVFEYMEVEHNPENTLKIEFSGLQRLKCPISGKHEHHLADYLQQDFREELVASGIFLKSPLKWTENKQLSHRFDFDYLFQRLYWRIQLLDAAFGAQDFIPEHYQLPSNAVYPELSSIQLKRVVTKRNPTLKDAYASPSWKGHLIYYGDCSKYLPYLLFGQYCHIGSDTNFGNGRYVLKIFDNTDDQQP